MKRSLIVLTAVAVTLTPLAATAAPPKASTRTLTYDYAGFQAGGATAAGSFSSENGCQVVDGCWDFDTKKGEKTIEFKASQANAGFQVFYDDAYEDTVVLFCGAGKITVSPKGTHLVSVRTSLHDCGGVATTGTLTATISNK
jgi:hypothetical protein